MVIVSPTTMSSVVTCISGCGPLSQVSQVSQLEITLPVTAPLEYRDVCPNVPSVATVPTLPSCFTSAAKSPDLEIHARLGNRWVDVRVGQQDERVGPDTPRSKETEAF